MTAACLFTLLLSCQNLDYVERCGSTFTTDTFPDGGKRYHTIIDGKVMQCGRPP